MPLDATTRTATLADAFAALSLGLRPKTNQDAIAERWATAKIVVSMAEKEYEASTKEMVAAGVLPDHATAPLALGVHANLFVGSNVSISAMVVRQADKFDEAGFVAELAGLVKPALLKRLRAKYTRPQKNAHRYSATLLGS